MDEIKCPMQNATDDERDQCRFFVCAWYNKEDEECYKVTEIKDKAKFYDDFIRAFKVKLFR